MFEDGCNVEEGLRAAGALLKSTFVPCVTSDEPYGEEAFKDYRPNAEKNFEYLKNVLNETLLKSKEKSDFSCNIDKSFITSVLVLCAEHTSQQPWSTPVTMKLSQEILDILCELHSSSVVGECLVRDKKVLERSKNIFLQTSNLFKLTLLHLHPKLLKDNWKCNPASVVAFQWLLFQVRFPYLNLDNHGMVFTTSLIILDDFVSENKVIGIKCLHHYTENVTTTDFRCQGRDVVIYDALFSHLYTREAKVLEHLLPCILICLIKMEPMMTTPDNKLTPYVYQWGRFEEVLNNIFSAMMMDERLEVRKVYLKFLPQFIIARGVRVVLFTSQVLSVMDNYLEARGHGSGSMIKTTLEVFLTFMKTIQPRLPTHALDILQLLLRKLQDVSSRDCKFEEGNTEVIIQLICENIKFLVDSSPVHYSDFSTDFIKSLGLNKNASSALMKACDTA